MPLRLLGTIASSVQKASTAFESIATANATGSSSTITFSSIPSTYQHLQLRGILRDNAGGNSSSSVRIQFNNSGSSAGASHWLQTIGASPAYTNVGNDTGDMYIQYLSVGSAVPANIYGAFIMDILDYKSTSKNKTIRNFVGSDANGNANASQFIGINSNLWISTSAINQITLVNQNNNAFASGSTVALYGIKGA